ncbi:MAG TPA: DUF1080 domain-containing protein [Pirellulales bacterium]|jgi:hypothetical protein|nr:DUF1080 domain-containing protein [Pirellulales bacterium]
MRRLTVCFAALILASAVAAQAEDGFKPLFNGKNLDGWVGDPDLWSVQDGVIVGTTDKKDLKHNSFLATKDSYSNFVLKAKFKLRNHNSGIQIRSKLYDEFVVKGYQPDIDEGNYIGCLYEEGGRGVLSKPDSKQVMEHVKKGDWNEYEITADGPHIVEKINGFITVDYTEKDEKAGAKDGIIALQLHAGPKMRVEFKDIEIKVLKK